MKIENELISLVILKTKFVHSNEDTANNHLPSSTKIIGAINEMFAFAYSFEFKRFLWFRFCVRFDFGLISLSFVRSLFGIYLTLLSKGIFLNVI